MRGIIAFIVALAIVAFLAPLAFAQTTIVEVAPPTFLDNMWAQLQAPVLLLLTTVVTAAAGWLAVKVNTFFNVTNEAQQKANEVVIRNVLHEAVWSAVKYALTKTNMSLPVLKDGMPSKEFIDIAIDYVRTKNPDTAAAAGLSPSPAGDKGLTEIIVSKVPDLIKMLTEATTTNVTVKAPVAAKPAARK